MVIIFGFGRPNNQLLVQLLSTALVGKTATDNMETKGVTDFSPQALVCLVLLQTLVKERQYI